jgi:addiction module HigA family antidote
MSFKNSMRPVHPGEILRDELEELGLSANAMAHALDVPANRISAILKGQRGVTADTALRLSRFFGTTPQVWLNLQKTYELRVAENASGKQIAKSVKPWDAVANA